MDRPERDGQAAEAPRRGQPYEIPVEGSLALLALGDVGLRLWRRRRAEAMRQAGPGAGQDEAAHDG